MGQIDILFVVFTVIEDIFNTSFFFFFFKPDDALCNGLNTQNLL